MKKLLILMVFTMLFAQETTHIVVPGDCLWFIADYYYQNPYLWTIIWRANLAKIEDPHWIYPDQVFVIPPAPEEAIGEYEEYPEYIPEVVTPPPVPKKVMAEVISVVEADRRIFSEDIIHRAGFILEEDLPYWGKIIGTEPSGEVNIAAYKTVYIDRAIDLEVDDVLTVYREGENISHPKTGARLGKEIIVLGKVKVEAISNEGSRCEVIASYDIIRNGDLLMPYEPILAPANVELVKTEKDVEGYVVKVRSDDRFTMPHVFVYVDQGEEHGAAVGDVYVVYQERKVDGKEMPDFDIAKVELLSIFRYASIGLLLSERETLRVERGEQCRLAMEAR